MKFLIVLVAVVAFAAADAIVGPSTRTTINGPDGSQIVQEDLPSVIHPGLVYPLPGGTKTVIKGADGSEIVNADLPFVVHPNVVYPYPGRAYYPPLVSSLYPHYVRYVYYK